MNRRHVLLIAAAFLTALGTSVDAQNLDTVRAGRFDYGKMWTFEYPPATYFSQTYGFDANEKWFETARLASLRIPGCSASFVSPDGLVVTNHHCARDYVFQVTKPGENLLDNGFFAKSLAAERSITDTYVEQLIAVEDVSAEVLAAGDRGTTDQERLTLRNTAAAAARTRIVQRNGSNPDIQVQIISLYNGGRYSAYTFRRYTNVKLVAAAELQLGFFGGDPDNFTYPRYALDFSFLRVYDDNGQPLRTPNYFTWSAAGVKEGDPVFVIGSPGPTNRLQSVAQLEYQRDVLVPAMIRAFDERLSALRDFYAENPVEGEKLDIRNRAFGLSNSLKAYIGRLDALRNPVIMAKKRDAERQLVAAIGAKPALQSQYGTALDRVAALQQNRRAVAAQLGAFALLGSPQNPGNESALIVRAMAALGYLKAVVPGGNADSLNAVRARLLAIPDQPPSLERRLLNARLADFEFYLGANSPIVQASLRGRAVPDAVAALLNESALATNARLATAIDAGTLTMSDPAMQIAAALAPVLLDTYARENNRIGVAETDLRSQLGRARFEINGTDVPPDASLSPRITDGVVKGFEYNGTLAPAFTTFYGLYDRHFSFPTKPDWALPKRWLPVPPKLDLNTPLDFAATADTYGGNSGSPAVTPKLELVGLNFDRNIQGLSRDFIYLPEAGRNIMVDVRAIMEALDDVYDLDRLVQELLKHRVFKTEAEADAVKR
ncbi:MAG: S46 family peptidase [Longimicrobiales bacterium]